MPVARVRPQKPQLNWYSIATVALGLLALTWVVIGLTADLQWQAALLLLNAGGVAALLAIAAAILAVVDSRS